MLVHIYRHGDHDSMDLYTSRVTYFVDGKERWGVEGPVLVLGTLPNTTVIPMSEIEWFWVEER